MLFFIGEYSHGKTNSELCDIAKTLCVVDANAVSARFISCFFNYLINSLHWKIGYTLTLMCSKYVFVMNQNVRWFTVYLAERAFYADIKNAGWLRI